MDRYGKDSQQALRVYIAIIIQLELYVLLYKNLISAL